MTTNCTSLRNKKFLYTYGLSRVFIILTFNLSGKKDFIKYHKKLTGIIDNTVLFGMEKTNKNYSINESKEGE